MPLVCRYALGISVVLALLMITGKTVTEAIFGPYHVIEPPPSLMPGAKNNLLSYNFCDSLHNGRFHCYVHLSQEEIELLYDGVSQTILYNVASTPDQKIGDLIAAWGPPSGIARDNQATVVYWTTRSAYLAPCSFQPATPVRYVAYGPISVGMSGWRGFSHRYETEAQLGQESEYCAH